MKEFVNGFTNWYETHHEVVAKLTLMSDDSINPYLLRYHIENGTGGMYELAKDITDSFEKKYEGSKWIEEDFFEAVENFVEQEIKKL